ncbi:unnamed protein product [Dicrocoelium dendriticum]|nr:unnamed protein product [Dicrocoelium dendriticum]
MDSLVWDSSEYLLQPVQEFGMFLITRISNYTVQHYDTCAEARDLEDAHCQADEHCVAGFTAGRSLRSPTGKLPSDWIVDVDADSHGVFTGRCRAAMQSCEIYGWCPVLEDMDSLHDGRLKPLVTSLMDLQTHADASTKLHMRAKTETMKRSNLFKKKDSFRFEPMLEVLNFTVTIKNVIEFPRFEVARQNILNWMDKEYLHTCTYQPHHNRNRYCPNFRIGDIIDLAGGDKYRLLRHGGVVAITINWQCDLDLSIERCLPRYDFLYLDGQGGDNKDSPATDGGWPMAVAVHVGESNSDDQKGPRRLLTKVNGVQFLIRVTGEAGKFNLFIFTMNFGSNLALLSLASYVCDYLLFNCTHDRKRFIQASRATLVKLANPITFLSGSRKFVLFSSQPAE